MSKSRKKKKRKLNIFSLIIGGIFIILTGILIYNLIILSNIETLLRIIIIVVLLFVLGILVVFQKKKKILCRIVMIILSLIYIFLNYSFYRVYSSLDNITKNVDTKGICLVAGNIEKDSLDDITNESIAVVNKNMDEDFYEMVTDIIDKENLENDLVEYEDYIAIINALLNKEIEYAFLPENYEVIYNANNGEENVNLNFSILYTEQKEIENKDVLVSNKTLDEPFTILLMGTDALLDSYNADTLMVLTVNPKTLKVTMLSIPRDTYATIACTGGKHKINASGWYGDSCVVKTVSKYLDIEIDYYAKINFLGIVELVDYLTGVEEDDPYAFCEQNSRREWGNSTVYVESGFQTLNGEQALALSRNRHYWTERCPKKYTIDGNRSDLTRGVNQQLVIKAILSKLMTIRDINTFYGILDVVGDNMTTNMSRDTILSLYNVGKSVVKRLNAKDADDVINIERLTLKNYFATIYLSGLELSTIVNYNESVEYVSKQMKKNLGLIKQETIKDFSFDINEEYDPNSVKYSKLTTNLRLLDNMVGKTLGEAYSYCNKNGITCTSSSNNNSSIVVSQSIPAKTDLATMRSKTMVLGVENTYIDNSSNKNDNDIDTIPDNKENNNTDNKVNNNTDNKGDDNKVPDNSMDDNSDDDNENLEDNTSDTSDNSNVPGENTGNNKDEENIDEEDKKEEGDLNGEE